MEDVLEQRLVRVLNVDLLVQLVRAHGQPIETLELRLCVGESFEELARASADELVVCGHLGNGFHERLGRAVAGQLVLTTSRWTRA